MPRSSTNESPPSPARRPHGCLANLLGVVALALLVGLGSWLWDAVVEAPWAHTFSHLTGDDRDGRALLTGPWIGAVTSPSGRLRGVLWLRIERRQWGASGRTPGVTGPSYPDFSGDARVCGLGSRDPTTTAPRKLWGYASRDASRMHVQFPYAPGPHWNLHALEGAWHRADGALVFETRLDSNGGSAPGGAPQDDAKTIRVTLRRAAGEQEFGAACRGIGVRTALPMPR